MPNLRKTKAIKLPVNITQMSASGYLISQILYSLWLIAQYVVYLLSDSCHKLPLIALIHILQLCNKENEYTCWELTVIHSGTEHP